MPLKQSSRTTVFLPTDFPEKRYRILLPAEQLHDLPEDSTDVFCKNIVEKYAATPDNLEEIFYCKFGAYYYSSNMSKDSQEEEEETNEKHIILKNNLGRMRKRKRPAIVRFHKVSESKEPELYYFSRLLLFWPWRNEISDLKGLDGKYETKYKEVEQVIERNRANYERHEDIIEAALNDENVDLTDAWATVAAQSEQERLDHVDNEAVQETEILDSDDESAQQVDLQLDNVQSQQCKSQKDFSIEFNTIHMPRSEYLSLVFHSTRCNIIYMILFLNGVGNQKFQI